MTTATHSIDELIETLSATIEEGIFPHYHFCGPHENDVQYVATSVISPHYQNKSMVLEIHMLDNQSESSLIQMILSFCNLQAVVASTTKRKPKIVIIHQQNEALTESFVHFLDNKMVEKHVRFVFLTASMHIVPDILLNKLVSFTIHPLDSVSRIGNVDVEDVFYKILHDKDTDDATLADTIIEWSDLHCLRLPPVIYDQWYDDIVESF